MSNERLACSEDIQELLWAALSAHWPEACANAASHNHAVTIAIHRLKSFQVMLYKA